MTRHKGSNHEQITASQLFMGQLGIQHADGRGRNEGGKGMSVYDIREAGENISDWKVATDSYHRYREDFDLMQDLGMNCYRFQISEPHLPAG